MSWLIVTNGEFVVLLCETCDTIELPFGAMSGVGLKNGVLYGGLDPQWARGSFRGFVAH